MRGKTPMSDFSLSPPTPPTTPAVQVVAWVGILVITLEWVIQFLGHERGLDWDRLPTVGAHESGVLGNILINFSCTAVIPSWINSKRASVNTNTVIWGSFGLGTALLTAVAVFGAAAASFPIVGGQQSDLLSILVVPKRNWVVTNVCAYVG